MEKKFHIHGRVNRPLIPRDDVKENPYTCEVEEEFESQSLDKAFAEFKKRQANKYPQEDVYVVIYADKSYEITT